MSWIDDVSRGQTHAWSNYGYETYDAAGNLLGGVTAEFDDVREDVIDALEQGAYITAWLGPAAIVASIAVVLIVFKVL